MNFAFINGVAVIFKDDGSYVECDDTHPEYSRVLECIKEKNFDEAIKLCEQDLEKKINEKYKEDGVVYDAKTESVYINGELQHSHIATRIAEHAKANLPFEHLLKFIERLNKNPSYNSRMELYNFLESKHIQITDDGCFLGYKSVRANFTDWHSGKFDNRIGQTPSVPREEVDDNPNNACSSGLHVGNYEYASSFYCGSDRQLLMVKVDPSDVVSVPTYACNKLRCCKYEVISLCKNKLEKNIYRDDLSSVDEDYEDSYEWEEDEYWDGDED